MFGTKLKKWKAVKDVLDFSDEGESIFGRKTPLVEPSLDRILSGLVKFVAGGKDKFLLKYNSMSQSGKYNAPGVDDPCPTISTQGRLQVCSVNFIQQRNTGNPNSKVIGVDQPARTLTASGGNMDLVQSHFLAKYYSGRPDGKVIPVDVPAGAIKTVDSHSLITGSFLSAYYGNGHNHSVEAPAPVLTTKDRLAYVNPKFITSYNYKDEPKDIESPCPTVLTKDRFALVNPRFLVNSYSGGGQHSDIEKPCPAVTQVPKQNVVQCERWLMNTNFMNVGNSLDTPAPVVTANRKWHYLMDAQYSRVGNNIDQPCFTLIARMDKTPPYLVEISTGSENIPSFIRFDGNCIIYEIYDTDSPKTKEIKEFMALYGLVDIKMRMLRIPELKQIMGFPKDYKLIGTQAEQKKYIGNAVEVNMAKFLCLALVCRLFKMQTLKDVI